MSPQKITKYLKKNCQSGAISSNVVTLSPMLNTLKKYEFVLRKLHNKCKQLVA